MTKALLLIPTDVEKAWAGERLSWLAHNNHIEVCGLGPILAAARTAQLVAHYRPARVWLVGIGGAIDAQLPLGSALEMDQVACYGIGVGCGDTFQTIHELGWHPWNRGAHADSPQILDETIKLDSQSAGSDLSPRLLLTTCAASADPQDVHRRRLKFPTALVEDMEGYAVATACQLAQVPLRIIRGISNYAGDRQHQHWQTQAAMRAAVELTLTCQ
jgi:futalosine hydrolase